ncbi:CHAD domain-containing protein [Steroidobacter agaridevorans]|uniref:CHAD domain-containing protein n=1 Tax=Steroidobacter agaridevorans TaxID=2695856 RepID=UPI001322E473|nr:CHAD domain-containing protein [Steroidobacter agaridevorans]GFE88624.1 CHAD domain-containing protein [Steroidobacter agaridevorans]
MHELQSDEAGLSGVRRILQEWLAGADESLRKKRITDANIHDARKQLKKSRAALRLLRGSMGEIAYRRENSALRDAARPLGVARDSKVLMAALDDLVERYDPATRSLKLDRFRRVLRQEKTSARQAINITLVNRQRKALREVRARSQRWTLKGGDWTVIGGGLRRIYRGGKKRMKAAEKSRDSADLHDWRKQVKYLWHQLQILQPAWPGPLQELADQTHKLADHLGDDHDLAVLRARIACHADAFESKDYEALVAVLDRRRKRLQDKAFELGARIFQEKPPRFVGRIGQYWRLWRSE